MAITLSHGGPTIYRSPAPSRQVLVGTIEGVACIERESGGPGWHMARRTLAGKHIHALLLEPESGTLFAGVNHGSIFASSDGGESWERRDKGLTEHNIYSLACARLADGVRVFAGTEPAHLFYSDDLGNRWAELPAFRSVDTSRWSFPAPPSLKERIGYDAGSTRVEDALASAARHGFFYLDFNADTGANRLDAWDAARVHAVRQTCERHGIHLGLHTSSAVNVAEFSPHVSQGVDDYLRANVDLASRLGCEWVVVHGGYHFSSALKERIAASLERLKRLTAHAEATGAQLVLENLNREPDRAEIHYLAHNVEECRIYFDAIQSANFGWAFTVNHAHLVPEGIGGFIDAFGVARIGEVRLADNTGEYEIHLLPGEGTIDFKSMFARLESNGYRRHYTMAFGSLDDKIKARDRLAGAV